MHEPSPLRKKTKNITWCTGISYCNYKGSAWVPAFASDGLSPGVVFLNFVLIPGTSRCLHTCRINYISHV